MMKTFVVFGLGMAAGLAAAGLSIGRPAAADQGAAAAMRGDGCPCPGDADCNGIVNFADITEVLTNWNFSCAPDTDGDGVPDAIDNCPLDANPSQEDTDMDGMGDACDPVEIDNDMDGWPSTIDCDDDNAQVFPGAQEFCNGIDDDCDAQVDEDAVGGQPWYRDVDGDGWGNAGDVVFACFPPPGFVDFAGDCNDFDSFVHPGMPEICHDWIDNNCDGLIDPDCGPIP
jgi:hypothetical protein